MISEHISLPDLHPTEPLSQVVFIYDYIQLIFESRYFNLYNLTQLVQHDMAYDQGHSGFCDALVSLMGNRVVQVYHCTRYKLVLEFENGAKLYVPAALKFVCGPEAFQSEDIHGRLIVGQNN